MLVGLGATCVYIYGAGNYRHVPLPAGNIPVPRGRTLPWNADSAFAAEVRREWAAKPLRDWATRGKDDVPRVALARLLTRERLPEVNAYLLGLRPRGAAGSKWALNPGGDYDFSVTVFTTVLWLCGDDATALYPATREHLVRVLLTEDGGAFSTSAPRTLGLSKETENHILMTEGSRYLKNRWLHAHGDTAPRHDNLANGMETRLLALLAETAASGLHEFNSQPYVAYTLTALLNLEAFASAPVRAAARDLLDYLNWSYALGSYGLRHYPPFRRSYGYASAPSLTFGYQTVFIHAWLSYAPGPFNPPAIPGLTGNHALIATSLPYRPPDAAVRLLSEKSPGTFVRLGHGPGATPEIYSAGPGFLLSAGGVHRGEASMIAARPTVLLLNDRAADLAEVFHLAGPGPDFRRWNNTGVHAQFACAAGPVHVPARFTAHGARGPWRLFAAGSGLSVAVYSTPTLGLLAVFPRPAADDLLAAVLATNPDEAALRRTFVFPGGRTLTYDVSSPPDRWVMIADSGQPLDRDFDRWPLIDGRL
ncbi:MAG: hypothetical protein H7343_14055 [Undibacterium sp.]|nr:hypothetical protein [Opitutaceae bacterium]